MPHPTPTWDAPVWAHLHAASPGLPYLMAALQAAEATCDAAITLDLRTPGFDAATGWATCGGILAGLRLTTGQDPPPAPAVPVPPSMDAAATVVDRLYRDAADHALAAVLDLRDGLRVTIPHGDHTTLPTLEALAATMSDLADSYTETFGHSW